MDVVFQDDNLDRLESDVLFDAGYHPVIVKAYRKLMQHIRSATDERDFYGMKSMRFEKLLGTRAHQRSLRLNDRWRLIIELSGKGEDKVVIVIGIEDYH